MEEHQKKIDLGGGHTLIIATETVKLSDLNFLHTLPPAQRESVEAYARRHKLSNLEAFNELRRIQIEEDAHDRNHR